MTSQDWDPLELRTIRWSDRAMDDLAAIGDYIATDNPAAAARWVDLIIADVERAAAMPLAGRMVPEHERTDIREVIRRRYRIVYQVNEKVIDVLTIFEGHRLFPEGVVPDDREEDH